MEHPGLLQLSCVKSIAIVNPKYWRVTEGFNLFIIIINKKGLKQIQAPLKTHLLTLFTLTPNALCTSKLG